MTNEKKQEMIDDLLYYWKDRGYMERHIMYKEAIDLYPELKAAYEDYLLNKRKGELLIESVFDEIRAELEKQPSARVND